MGEYDVEIYNEVVSIHEYLKDMTKTLRELTNEVNGPAGRPEEEVATVFSAAFHASF